MRRASNILLLVGGIYSIVCAVTFFVTAIVFFVGGTPIYGRYLEEALIQAGIDDPERVRLLVQLSSILCGVAFIICAILCIPSAILSFVARNKPTKGLLIANIVIGYLCGTTYNVVGGILGLIYNWRLAKKEARQSQVVDVQ